MVGAAKNVRAVVAVAALLVAGPGLQACPFCTAQGQTLTGEYHLAPLVLVGTPVGGRLDGDAGTTDLAVTAVLKPHPALGARKVVTLQRLLVAPDERRVELLVFCDVNQGKVDPYRCFPVSSRGDVERYLRGAAKLQGRKPGDRLAHFFDFLDHREALLADDAYKEFGNASPEDYRELAKALPAERLAGWLKDRGRHAARFGLYGSLLGHTGRAEYAPLLRSLVDDPEVRGLRGLDGLLAGYAVLRPAEGWPYLRDLLLAPGQPLAARWAALRAARFLWDSRPDVVPPARLAEELLPLLDQSNMADLLVEDLRQRKNWAATARVLALQERPAPAWSMAHRAVLRYALSCPGEPAAAFVREARKRDPREVRDLELRLEFERQPPPSPNK
jgi:hypothetical protein